MIALLRNAAGKPIKHYAQPSPKLAIAERACGGCTLPATVAAAYRGTNETFDRADGPAKSITGSQDQLARNWSRYYSE